jgi:3-phytase (myo-inositol-hexaphosphate 3-phosphohydrolase)
MPDMLEIGTDNLIQPVKIFGQPYIAILDDEGFGCEYNPEREPEGGEIFTEGDESLAGEHIQADLEGITIYFADDGEGYLIASSQGDSTFQIFERGSENDFVGAFQVSDVGDTDGLDVVNVSLGSDFPNGLLVVHNGEVPEPDDTSDINGFEYDGSTQFKYVRWEDVANAFPESLIIDPD